MKDLEEHEETMKEHPGMHHDEPTWPKWRPGNQE